VGGGLSAVRPLLVGVTGGIGSGKSTVDRMLAARGAAVIDADAVVHELLGGDPDTIAAVIEAFGPGVSAAGGGIDRRALGVIVFGDAAARARLEGIVHPRVTMRIRERITGLAAGPIPPDLIVVDAALMVETGTWRDYDRVVVVTAPETLRRGRLVRRGGLTEAQAAARIAAQAPESVRLDAADYVIRNDGTEAALEAEVAHVHARLLEDFAAAGRPRRAR